MIHDPQRSANHTARQISTPKATASTVLVVVRATARLADMQSVQADDGEQGRHENALRWGPAPCITIPAKSQRLEHRNSQLRTIQSPVVATCVHS